MNTLTVKEPGFHPLEKILVQAVIRQAGIFAITFRDKIDYRYGLFLEERHVEHFDNRIVFDMKFKFWTTDGKAVSVSVCSGRGLEHNHFILSTGDTKDPERPKKPNFPDAMQQKCINPFCNNFVDLAKTKSGACCRECMNYECTHPDCGKRAQENGWKRATHAWDTKIGKAHLPYRKTA